MSTTVVDTTKTETNTGSRLTNDDPGLAKLFSEELPGWHG